MMGLSKEVIKSKRVADIVMENTQYARRLYYLGIDFNEHKEATLEQLSGIAGVQLEKITAELTADEPHVRPDVPLQDCPVRLIVEFLKHEHHRFVKHMLPYLSQLVKSMGEDDTVYGGICRDLKVLYPLFHEDFINHIYNEEDTLFKYLLDLDKALQSNQAVGTRQSLLKSELLPRFGREHVMHDDEMYGIRKLTRNYELTPKASLQMRVLYAELKELENNLREHAKVENEILFPKAVELETQVISKFFSDEAI